MLIVFRFDASPAIGGGHAIRCAALAAELSRQGHACGFAANDAGVDLAEAIVPDAGILRLSDDRDELEAMTARWPAGAGWLVVDHYGRDIAFERAANGWARKIMAVDDLPTRPHASDILVDQTLGRTAAEYRTLVDRGCNVLAGADYTLLREDFRAHRKAALVRRDALPATPRIVISFGASDSGKASIRTLNAMSRISHLERVEIVVGALCPHLDEIKAAAAGRVRTFVIVDPASVAPHFVNSDIAIGAPGMSAWERACLGLPSIVIPVADNQVDNAAALQRHGAAIALPSIDRVTPSEIEAAIETLVNHPDRWQSMATAAASIVDGDGAKRVSAAMGA